MLIQAKHELLFPGTPNALRRRDASGAPKGFKEGITHMLKLFEPPPNLGFFHSTPPLNAMSTVSYPQWLLTEYNVVRNPLVVFLSRIDLLAIRKWLKCPPLRMKIVLLCD